MMIDELWRSGHQVLNVLQAPPASGRVISRVTAPYGQGYARGGQLAEARTFVLLCSS
jgi:hypothetical protein